MAKMIPNKPREFTKESLEDLMFTSLENLPEEYYVFHSLKIVTVQDGIVSESETDFVIFNPKRGIICLEAKAGHVKYQDGDWYYASGVKMAHSGPYNQAAKNKWILKDYIQNSICAPLLGKCKLLHAVWFPSVARDELNSRVLPPEAENEITLTKDDLGDPLPIFKKIFEQELPNHVQTILSDNDCDRMLRKVLCPSFDLLPSLSMEIDLEKQVFHRMLSEQKCVLNYLIEQNSAVIQGVAGTGKTLIALEKARRHADAGEKVLFLCYNKFLRDHIAESNLHPNIDFYTIDGYACKLSNSSSADYLKVREVLEEYYVNESFPYTHIIIDEGQDFGQSDIEENEIISLLSSIIIDRDEPNGTFYVFYDGMQLVQGGGIPDYISNADCKLTLYKNCRNTENIAITSMKPLRNKKPKLIDGCIKGTVPKMYFCENTEDQIQQVDSLIQMYESHGIEDLIILTCKTEGASVLTQQIYNGQYKRKYKFTTCRKFKGLEADAVIIVDIDESVLLTNATKLFYVGTSRARLYLGMVTDLTKEQCTNILEAYEVEKILRNPQKQLATELNALYVKVDN